MESCFHRISVVFPLKCIGICPLEYHLISPLESNGISTGFMWYFCKNTAKCQLEYHLISQLESIGISTEFLRYYHQNTVEWPLEYHQITPLEYDRISTGFLWYFHQNTVEYPLEYHLFHHWNTMELSQDLWYFHQNTVKCPLEYHLLPLESNEIFTGFCGIPPKYSECPLEFIPILLLESSGISTWCLWYYHQNTCSECQQNTTELHHWNPLEFE